MTPEGDFSRVELVAHLRSREVLVHDQVRAQLTELLPETELAEAWARFREIEARTGLTGVLALERATMVPPAEPSPPGEPRHPVTPADLELAAWLNTDDILPYDQVRRQLGEVLQRSPLGPAVWRMREIEWAMTVPPTSPRPLQGIAALEAWDEAGELADELLAPAEPAAAPASERFHSATVVHQLLARIRAEPFHDVETRLRLAECAVAVSQALLSQAGSGWQRWGALHALALVVEAHARRLAGISYEVAPRLSEADVFIGMARDPFLRGQYYGYKAATLIFMRRLKEAREASAQSMSCYQQAGDRQWMAKQLLQLSYIDFAGGELSGESLIRLERAAELANPFRHDNLRDVALLNLARYQAELGCHVEAMDSWRQVRPFGDSIAEMQRLAIAGVIHLGAERWQSAVEQLSLATEGLAAAGHCDSFYYSLVLALALDGQGRYEDAMHAAGAAASHFSQAQVESVALAAKAILTCVDTKHIAKNSIAALVRAVDAAPIVIAGAARSNIQP